IYEEMRSSYQVQIVKAERALRDLYNQWAIDVATGKGQSSRLNGIHRRLLLVEKGALAEAVRRGILTDDTAKDQLRQIDEKLLKLGED
ncbi:sodium:proton antiporter, partial [Leptolyngbya sp. FACHB-711]|nr:sodium:proton antiporter [Leptolyngbya sp. FACHB-711]